MGNIHSLTSKFGFLTSGVGKIARTTRATDSTIGAVDGTSSVNTNMTDTNSVNKKTAGGVANTRGVTLRNLKD